MIAYKEWGYQLFPGLAFEDLTDRIEKLGGKARTRDLMSELRDRERDRAIEAKYGRSAVDNARARKISKQAAQEADEKNESEVEDIAGSRYMDVDKAEDQGAEVNEGSSLPRAKTKASGMLSEEVRERMEANRRQALERLRLKKEGASNATTSVARQESSGAGVPMDVSEGVDPMDLDARGGVANSSIEDDEVALAEMEAEENLERAATNTGAATVGIEATDPPPDATTTTFTPLISIANGAPVLDSSTASPPLTNHDETLEDLMATAKASGIRAAERAGNSADVATTSLKDTVAEDIIDTDITTYEAAAPDESTEVATMLENTRPHSTQMTVPDEGGHAQLAPSEISAAAQYASTLSVTGSVAKTKEVGHEEEGSMGSPSKRTMPVSRRTPLSPLGALLASTTDVPAEGERRLYERR